MNYKQFVLRSGIGFAVILICINVIAFLSVDMDQFNVFHRYDQVHRLETWNLPFNAEEDFDGDGISDRMTFTGCLFLSTMKSEDTIKDNDCYDSMVKQGKRKGLQVFDYGERGKHQLIVSYLGKRNDENWNIVVVRNTITQLYELIPPGAVLGKKPPLSLKADSLLYFFSHLFVVVMGM